MQKFCEKFEEISMKFFKNFEELKSYVNSNETLGKFVQNFRQILKEKEDFWKFSGGRKNFQDP